MQDDWFETSLKKMIDEFPKDGCFADQLFSAWLINNFAEIKLHKIIPETIGCNIDSVPYDDLTFDHYDSSIEFKNAK